MNRDLEHDTLSWLELFEHGGDGCLVRHARLRRGAREKRGRERDSDGERGMERERGGGGNGREGESTREGVQFVRACAGEIRQKKENSHQRQKRKKEMRALM